MKFFKKQNLWRPILRISDESSFKQRKEKDKEYRATYEKKSKSYSFLSFIFSIKPVMKCTIFLLLLFSLVFRINSRSFDQILSNNNDIDQVNRIIS